MFSTYREIFAARGDRYHRAMTLFPHARQEEFRLVSELAEVEQEHLVCDLPSGGGYLKDFLPATAKILHVETSEVFTKLCRLNGRSNVFFSALDRLPFQRDTVDRVISLGALHHVEDKLGVFRECHRILRQGGMLCIADVWAGSSVADFLDGFVNDHNSLGHKGLYIDAGTAGQLRKSGFTIGRHSMATFPWEFDSIGAMTEFVQLLFGVDRASEADIIRSIDKYLGCGAGRVRPSMTWQLYLLQAVK
jgi:SAM-dependent methyltransferase